VTCIFSQNIRESNYYCWFITINLHNLGSICSHIENSATSISIRKEIWYIIWGRKCCRKRRIFYVKCKKQDRYSYHEKYIRGNSTSFGLLSRCYDERSREEWLEWIKIYEDVINYGCNAASSLNAVILDSEDKSKKNATVKNSVIPCQEGIKRCNCLFCYKLVQELRL
jgi:hypothetical protein